MVFGQQEVGIGIDKNDCSVQNMEDTCHGNGLYKRHPNATNSSLLPEAATAPELRPRAESPSVMTPEKGTRKSFLDSPTLKSRLPPSQPTTPNRRIRKMSPLTPYRSTSGGANPTVCRVLERQRSSGCRLIGNNCAVDNPSPSPCSNSMLTPCHQSTRSPQRHHRLIGNLSNKLGFRRPEGMLPRRNKIIFGTLIMAVAFSIWNLAFFTLDLISEASPSPSSRMIKGPSSKKKKSKRAKPLFNSSDTSENQQERSERQTSFFVVHPPRIVCLAGNNCQNAEISSKENSSPRHILLTYPSEFSDVTQLYPKYPSNDVLQLKSHDPLVNEIEGYGNCVPMNSSWQTTFHPTCNAFHELDLSIGLRKKTVDLFGLKGFWRLAWKVVDDDYLSGYLTERFLSKYVYYGNIFNRNTQESTILKMKKAGISENLPHVVLKNLRYEHNFEEAWYEINRIDAVAMERATSSPYVMDIYGFCGLSALTEYGQGNFKSIVDEATPIEKLKYARDLSSGLASIHYIDGYNMERSENITLVHNDLNPSNVMMNQGNAKLNDFNVGIMMTWHKEDNRPCRFKNSHANAQWKAPEEQQIDEKSFDEPLSPKIDIYGTYKIKSKSKRYRLVVPCCS